LAKELVSKGLFGLAAKVFAKWTALDSYNAEPWSNLGLCLARIREYDQAKSCLEHALSLDQGFVMARHNLCEVLKELGEHQSQLSHALEAVRLDPSSAVAFNNVGTALIDNGMLEEAKHAFETSRLLEPGSFAAGFNLAWIAAEEGRTNDAIDFLEAALSWENQTKVQRVMAEYYLGQAYLASGRLEQGWHFYEHRFSSAVLLGAARVPKPNFPVPVWDGRLLDDNQTLLVWREQGIGDELRFAALLPELKKIGGKNTTPCEALPALVHKSAPLLSISSLS
jgi:tetratricopeptide (TPR) repeat protein